MTVWQIDEITWNDLDMERVYEKINTAKSSVGEEYLKTVLQNTRTEEEVLLQRSCRADFFSGDPAAREQFSKVFQDMGKTKKLSLYAYLFRFHEVPASGNTLHYLMILLLLAAIACIFVRPVIGILFLVVMFAINIGSYFRYKARVEGYFMCFKYIVRMIRAASKLSHMIGAMPSYPEGADLSEWKEQLDRACAVLAPIKRGSFLLTNSVSGSLIDVVMDYVRMLFHVDIIHFNHVRKLAQEQSEEIDRLFCTLGETETVLCISRFRDSLESWCRPQFLAYPVDARPSLKIRSMYHPLTRTVVTNDLTTDRSVLLTGSNASGKSTFLKQLAINQILAQTIHTCLAAQYETSFFRVLSSMALTDDILGEESYFIVEIRSLKRILDAADDGEEKGGVPVMCFIDEVLRGTNTKERIAASTQILKYLAEGSTLCFAATHDIELTRLLERDMVNYHFEEQVKDNDVIFDYKIRSGPATTRNAIKLMQAYGYAPKITEGALLLSKEL